MTTPEANETREALRAEVERLRAERDALHDALSGALKLAVLAAIMGQPADERIIAAARAALSKVRP